MNKKSEAANYGLVYTCKSFCIQQKIDQHQCYSMIDPRHEKNQIFSYAKTKTSTATAQLISAFVFTAWMVQFLLYLYPKFQDSNFLLRLYRPVCVRPGQNLEYWFSRVLAHSIGPIDSRQFSLDWQEIAFL